MSSYQGHTSIPVDDAYDFKMQLAREMRGHFVGPMPPQEFLNKFLPTPDLELPNIPDGVFSSVPTDKAERDMYDPFIKATSGFAPNAVAWDTSNAQNAENTAQLGHYSLKPDVSMYWKGNSLGDKQREKRTDFSLMEMHVEFKKADADDPFDDKAGRVDSTNLNFEKDTQSGCEQRGQITAYALAQLVSQFRRFVFSLFIAGKFARFIRWDRAGAVVSGRFDYTKDPLLLTEFLWRFFNSSPEERGIDTSVSLASFDDCPEDEIRIRRILSLNNTVPLYRYAVPEDVQSRIKRYEDERLIGPLTPYYYYGPMPPYPKLSLIGRSTRSLPVVDLRKKNDDEAHVYLKDAWRIDLLLIEKEGDIYRSLHAASVPHIAPFERGNDVVGHGYQTQTQRFTLMSWVSKPRELTGYAHYRMVLGIVGKALTSFSSSKEYVSAIRNALIAHKHAYEDAEILHRDISASNVIIALDGGYLIDWDLCKRLRALAVGDTSDANDSAHSPRRRDRTGTWQFMSAMILRDRSRVQDRVDDLESFLHVLCWVALRYVDNVMADDDRSNHLREVFDEVKFRKDVAWRGWHKELLLRSGSYVPENLAFKKPSPLLQLLKDIAEVFKWRYIQITEEDRRRYRRFMIRLLPDTPEYEDYIADSPVHNYESAMGKLRDASWFLDTINDSLSLDFTWPADDEASLMWLPVDTTAPRVKQARQRSHAGHSELARAFAYATSSCTSQVSRVSSKRGRPESQHDDPVKRPRGDKDS